MTQPVTAVIATVGRPSLTRAVCSVLEQTRPVAELIVVVDGDHIVDLPPHARITLLANPHPMGPGVCRQRGIDAARGDVIALLDDDDEWHPIKIDRQLKAVEGVGESSWIASSRMTVMGPGDRQRVWPRRLIEPGQSVADYLFRFTNLRVGDAVLQTSTLCFPTELARKVRWDADAGAVHDEPSWLIRVQRSIPDVRVIQLPDVLSTYNVGNFSLSRGRSDYTDRYIDWGLQQLRAESPRLLGDYLCTSPVSAAASAHSITGVARAVAAAYRHGRPGPYAVTYAGLNAVRIAARSIGRVGRR
ncbi:MAG: glycosyltransferase family 2 protein [Candidatus Nanopelagicales bacterium]